MPDAMNVLDSIADFLAELLLIELHLKNIRRGDETQTVCQTSQSIILSAAGICVFVQVCLLFTEMCTVFFKVFFQSMLFKKNL